MTFQLPLSSSRYDQQTLTFIRALKKLGLSSIRHCCPAWHVDVNATFAESSMIRGSLCLGCYRADAAAQSDAPASNHPPILSRVSNFGSAGNEWEGRHFVLPLPSPPRRLASCRIRFRETKRQTHCRGLRSCILALRSVRQLSPPALQPARCQLHIDGCNCYRFH